MMQVNPCFTSKNKSSQFFYECMCQYNDFIELVAKLMIEMKSTDHSIVLCRLIRSLLIDGYFSTTDKFHFSSCWNIDVDKHYYGMDVITGNGCCRHVAGFYDNLFTQLRIPDRFVPCYCTTSKEQFRDYFQEANHAYNLISYLGTIYGYDVSSDVLFKSKDAFKMTEICPKEAPDYKQMIFYYKPFVDREIHHLSRFDLLKRLFELQHNSFKKPIDYQSYLEFGEQAKSIIQENQGLLHDFDQETKVLRKELARNMVWSKNDFIDYHYH